MYLHIFTYWYIGVYWKRDRVQCTGISSCLPETQYVHAFTYFYTLTYIYIYLHTSTCIYIYLHIGI